MSIPSRLLRLLRCPATGQDLREQGDCLVSADGEHSYGISPAGTLLFGDEWLSPEGVVQRTHYDTIAGVYLTNLTYPHTREYMAFLDRAVVETVDAQPLETVAEICCGAGEAFQLFGSAIASGVGVDVSPAMLDAARRRVPEPTRVFVQGDATDLPLKSGQFDAVMMLGGIHHVNARPRLFSEVRRILKPGGVFVWREPVDDFTLWRVLRAVIYRGSPTLQADTERPLRYAETKAQLEDAGFTLEAWRTIGFLGYCFLMNSDVLAINRLWAYVPGAAALTRLATRLDEWALKLPGLAHAGVAVVGKARPR